MPPLQPSSPQPSPRPPWRSRLRPWPGPSNGCLYGVEDVLNLSRARISEDVILNYIRGSGTAYMIGPREIVYLRDEGVSDHVINTMIDQRKQVAADNAQQAVQQATQQAAQQALQSPPVAALPAVPGAPILYDPNALVPLAYPPGYDLPPEEDQPAPSSLYVIPDPAVRAAYYGAYGTSPYGIPFYGVSYPVFWGRGGCMVYHFGARYGGGYGHGSHGGGSHGGSVHVIPHR